MIKVTFEYATVDEAIVALAKLVGAPLKVASGSASKDSAAQAPGAPTTQRRGRSDKGQARGSYKNQAQTNLPVVVPVAPAQPSTGDAVPEPGQAAAAGSVGNNANPEVTDTGNEVVLPSTQPSTPSVAPASPVYTQKDVQEAVSNVFKTKGLPVALQVLQRFGANTYRDVLPAQYGGFIAHATFVSEGGQV